VVSQDYGSKQKVEQLRSLGYSLLSNKKVKVVVLVDGGSASASEIVAGALQDYKAATIMGEKTFGKGSVQEYIKITDKTGLKVTIARWLTPNGNSISVSGLAPDIEVKKDENTKLEDIKNRKDNQYLKAVEFLNK
jgi:carboxyl-terminal processing protease